jgi:hypothetical protein
MYSREGTYADSTWHAIRLYPGAINSLDEDCDGPWCWSADDPFPGAVGWEGWVERPVALGWISGRFLDLTIRLWNASVDVLRLQASANSDGPEHIWGSLKSRYLR